MRVATLVLAVSVLFIVSSTSVASPRPELLDAIQRWESGGSPNPPPGDDGEALGVFQIHKTYWKEGCKFLHVKWDYEAGARDPEKSRSVCVAYLSHYGKLYTKRTGKEPTDEVYARIHNGGPSGWKRRSTLGYWSKVKQFLPG